ncbi:MAG: hypothetical protein HEEMFOPI_01740 [Holosporales bacterium]
MKFLENEVASIGSAPKKDSDTALRDERKTSKNFYISIFGFIGKPLDVTFFAISS